MLEERIEDNLMEKGDVFRVDEQEPLYIAEAVAPNGTVYAREFDLYKGASGEPESFQSNVQFSVLFNTRKAENDEGWQYCEIRHAAEWADEWTGTEWFEAQETSSAYEASIARTPAQHFIRGETWLDIEDDKSKKMHQNLVDKLLADGWVEVIERRMKWYTLRLKRKK